MKFSEQGRIAASKSNQIIGMSRRNIAYKEKGLIVPLYKAIVSPHLEYSTDMAAQTPYRRKDTGPRGGGGLRCMIEKIQMRATKLIPGFRDFSYEETLTNY